MITKSESRAVKDEHKNSQERQQENDENGNTERRKSTGDYNDQDAQVTEKHELLQTIKDRSDQASPSNVCIEENEQTQDHSGNDDETSELNAGVVDRSTDSRTGNEAVSITDNADASQDQTTEKPVNNCNDDTTIANEDSPMTHEDLTTNGENLGIKMENSPEGSDQVQHTAYNVNSYDRDNEPVKMADNLNVTEDILSLNTKELVEENEQQQQQQQRIEQGENIDNSSDRTQTVKNVSTTQEQQSLHDENEDAVLGQSNGNQEVTS